jgi:hypothetical protein
MSLAECGIYVYGLYSILAYIFWNFKILNMHLFKNE